MAISASNTGGAWDNAKKYIEVKNFHILFISRALVLIFRYIQPNSFCVQAGSNEHAKALGPKGTDAHKAAVIGDTIGDPLKDTSGPSLNILIKLMAVESLVFAPFFAAHGGLLFKLL